jgi:hypothetical protein
MSHRPKSREGKGGRNPIGKRGARPGLSRPAGAGAVDSAPTPVPSGVADPAGDPVSDRLLLVHLTTAFVVGAALRLAFVTSQILLDDEWHALDYSIGNSLSFLLTHASVPGATCIPLNVYTWALLQTVGWNETLLRLPALMPGIGALVVLPWLVGKAFRRRTTVVFAWLLAICPVLISYSRIARPYGMVGLTGAASVLFGYLWLVSGRRVHAVLHVACGVVAVYFHLFAIAPVAAPLACALCFKLAPSGVRSAMERIRPSNRDVGLAIGAFAMALSVLVLPALVNAIGGPMSSVVGAGDMTIETLVGFASMLAGTASMPLVVLFHGLLAVGLVGLFKRAPLLASILLASAVFCYVSLAITHPDLIHSARVVSRYVVAAFPLALVLVADGVGTLANALPSAGERGRWGGLGTTVGWLASGALVVALFATGPMPRLYDGPNNFTGHAAFLESYAPQRWDRSYRSDVLRDAPVIDGVAALSPFYRRLASDAECHAIIEYPMLVGDHFNLYYYYQHFHRKRVLAGYFRDLDLSNVSSVGWVMGNRYADFVMSREHDPDKLRMSNMIDMASTDSVRRSGATYVVLHRRLMTEMFPQAVAPAEPSYGPVEYLTPIYRSGFGVPVFEDANLVVFRVSPFSPPAP